MKRSITAFLVIVSLLSALAGSCFEIELNIQKEQSSQSDEQKSAKSTEQSYISLDHFHAIVQLAQLVFTQGFNFEIKTSIKEELEPHAVFETALTLNKYHRILFRQFISPNAP